MTDRQRFVDTMLGKPVDRPPFWLFWGPWGRAWQRWETEGKPPDADHRSFATPDSPPHIVGVNLGPCPAIPPEVIEENADYVIHTDGWGIVRRDYKHAESMAEFLKFPVANRDDWEAFKNEHLQVEHPARLAGEWLAAAKGWMEAEVPIQIGHFPDCGVFGSVRWLLGDEECLLAFYTDPELVHDIMTHMTDIYMHVFHEVVEAGGVRFL